MKPYPEWLTQLAKTISNGLPKPEAKQFNTDLNDAVPSDSDLEPVRTRFLIMLQRRNLARLDGNAAPYADECRRAIQMVIEVLETKAARSTAVRSEVWSAALSAARSAALSEKLAEQLAAWSAESATWSAAWSAWSAESTAKSAESAWWASISAEAESKEAWSAEFRAQRDDLLALMHDVNEEQT